MPQLIIDPMNAANQWSALAPDGVTASTEIALTDDTTQFRNRDQPIELHVGGRVVMVPAWEHIDLDEEALQAPQIQALSEQRFITAVAQAPVAPAEEQETDPSSETPPEEPLEEPDESVAPPAPKAKSRGAKRRAVTEP